MSARFLFLALVGSALSACVFAVHGGGVSPQAYMTTPKLVKSLLYPFETHTVITSDGYILNHHRIPYGRDGPGAHARIPVVLQHGLCGDSSGWLLHNATQTSSIGYALADNGFDVWMMNTRGNVYSHEHTKYSTEFGAYYDFSYHEMAIYDLPQTIDYILHATNATRVAHIGHSQGTTTVYAMLARLPQYKTKLSIHIGWAPVAFLTHSINPLYRFLSPYEKAGILSTKPFRSFELVPRNRFISILLINACSNASPVSRYFCELAYYAMMGYNPSELNRTQLNEIYGHYPSSSSMKQFTHFVQGVNRPVFAEFDYKEENVQRYGTIHPPEYNLSEVEVPIYNFYGGHDAFVQVPDVDKLHGLLPNLIGQQLIEFWAHYDFLYGINAYEKVYMPTIEILKTNAI